MRDATPEEEALIACGGEIGCDVGCDGDGCGCDCHADPDD